MAGPVVSYDAWIALRVPGEDPADAPTVLDLGNYTSNVSPMFRHALTAAMGRRTVLGDLDGWRCGVLRPLLSVAVFAMVRDREQLLPLEPSNGWGDYAGALAYLRGIAEGCARFADVDGAVLRIYA